RPRFLASECSGAHNGWRPRWACMPWSSVWDREFAEITLAHAVHSARRMARISFVVVCLAAVIGFDRPAAGQAANSGALTGIVTDASSRQPLAGVTVVASGPQGEQAELTDDTGSYTITGLVPGIYVLRMFYNDVKVERQNVQVFADKKIQVNVPMQTKSG